MDLGVKKKERYRIALCIFSIVCYVMYSMIARTMLMIELAIPNTSAITDMETFVDFFFSLPFGTICTFR